MLEISNLGNPDPRDRKSLEDFVMSRFRLRRIPLYFIANNKKVVTVRNSETGFTLAPLS